MPVRSDLQPLKAMKSNKIAVRERLATVEDPGLDTSIVELGLVTDIQNTPETIRLSLALNAPYAPEERRIVDRIHTELAELDRSVHIHAAPESQPIPAARRPEGVRNVVGVTSGTTGVGKTTVTVNAALELAARGARVGILDADVPAPTVRRILGVADVPELDRAGVLLPPQREGITVLSVADVVGPDGSTTLSGPLLERLLAGLVHDVEWRPLDYLFIELPSGVDDATLGLLQTGPVIASIVVTSREPFAVAANRRFLARMYDHQLPVLGVVETSRPESDDSPSRGPRIENGRDLASAVGVPFLESLPVDPCDRSLRGGDDLSSDDEMTAAVARLVDRITNEVGRRQRQAVARSAGRNVSRKSNQHPTAEDDRQRIGSIHSG